VHESSSSWATILFKKTKPNQLLVISTRIQKKNPTKLAASFPNNCEILSQRFQIDALSTAE